MQDEDRERRIQELTEKMDRFCNSWAGTLIIIMVGGVLGALIVQFLSNIF